MVPQHSTASFSNVPTPLMSITVQRSQEMPIPHFSEKIGILQRAVEEEEEAEEEWEMLAVMVVGGVAQAQALGVSLKDGRGQGRMLVSQGGTMVMLVVGARGLKLHPWRSVICKVPAGGGTLSGAT